MLTPEKLFNSRPALSGYQRAAIDKDGAKAVQPRKKRAKLWELLDKNHCPVVGTCLPIAELRKIAHRFFSSVDPENDYAMHVAAVNHAKQRNPASETMQRYLDNKYRLTILAFDRAQTDADVEALWREFYERGEVASALWAAVTHKAILARTEQRILADIHMLSHQVGAGLAADSRRLAYLEKENAALKSALEQQKKGQLASESDLRRKLVQTIEERDHLASIESEAEELRTRIAYFESGQVMVNMGRKLITLQSANDELTASAQQAWRLEKNLKAAHGETVALALERDRLVAERDALLRLIEGGGLLAEEDGDCEGNCASDCIACPLGAGGNCVLCVGGRPSLVAQYRALAQRLGINLIHHDGGLEESLSRLPEMIHSADAVVCPTDCVSHAAYFHIKRQCKRSGKPCLLYKGSSVSGFAVALARLSAGQFTLMRAAPAECQ
ncbi:MAG: DUF2325 domain-containing protein [Propionivibrio sp.]